MPALEDDSKVMDVSKPGKSKPVATSRPIVAPIVKEEAKDESVKVEVVAAEEESATKDTEPKAATRQKTIEPLHDLQPEEGSESTDTDPADKAASAPEGDEAASVDAVVSQAETKKEAAKKAEEQAKKDAELQALIDSKKYTVPISGTSADGSKSMLIGVIFGLVALLAGGYLLADAGVFGDDVKVPFEIIKNQSEAVDTVRDTPAPASAPETKKEDSQPKPDEKSDEALPSVTAEIRARDAERKDELKNLQVKLETYFNDNGHYPPSLSDPELGTTADDRTDPSDVAYMYETDGETYMLSVRLENPNDRDAVDGIYSLQSVNQ